MTNKRSEGDEKEEEELSSKDEKKLVFLRGCLQQREDLEMSEARWLKNKEDLEIAKKILMVKEADKMLRRM